MNATRKSNSYSSIRSKLIAAVAMLLVASFMVVSSSYAWFTLSTAPEVTGISTAVGANGNLEIALLTGATVPDSTTSDGYADPLAIKNTTWGNLVDLSKEEYGLQKVVLKPAELNVDATGKIVAGQPIKTPVYSADGRISELTASSIVASYDTTSNTFKNTAAGVMAIGTSSGMTSQMIAYRTAMAALSTTKSSITKYAQNSLTTIGSQLGSAAVNHAAVSGTDGNEYDISNTDEMLAELKRAQTELEKHIKAYFDAAFAKAAEGLTEEAFDALDLWADNTLDSIFTSGINVGGVSITSASLANTPVWEAHEAYLRIGNAITAAETAYASVADNTKASWTDILNVFKNTNLVNIEGILVNGVAPTRDNIETLVGAVATGGGLTVQLPAGAGAYPDFATVTGNYIVSIKLTNISYGGITVQELVARMATTLEDTDIVDLGLGLTAPTSAGAAASTKIDDTYAYAIDLAFRTNAADSQLKLQTDAVDRIYSAGGSETTQGGGSYMEFTTPDNRFSPAQMTELMRNIRVVFANSGSEIVAVGVIDTVEVNGMSVKGALKLVEFSAADSKLTLVEDAGSANGYKLDDEQALMTLTQNQMAKVSVYVYLDGTTVTNADVATSGNSLVGSLNLQFASSADLKPMDYAPFQDPTKTGTGTETETPAETTVTPEETQATEPTEP